MKTIWIIDAGYMIKASPNRFDYLKLKAFLEKQNESSFHETYYLNSTQNPPTDQMDGFHTWLKSDRGPKMRVKLYKLKDTQLTCPWCSKEFTKQVQKGVDVGIATLIIKLAVQNQYQRLILSAGDGDFEDAIDFIKGSLQKEFWVSGFEGSLSSDLQSYANKVVWLDDHMDEIKKD